MNTSLCEFRHEASDTLDWIKNWRDGQFVPARTEDGWDVEMYGLADSAERLAMAVLGLTEPPSPPGSCDCPPSEVQACRKDFGCKRFNTRTGSAG